MATLASFDMVPANGAMLQGMINRKVIIHGRVTSVVQGKFMTLQTTDLTPMYVQVSFGELGSGARPLEKDQWVEVRGQVTSNSRIAAQSITAFPNELTANVDGNLWNTMAKYSHEKESYLDHDINSTAHSGGSTITKIRVGFLNGVHPDEEPSAWSGGIQAGSQSGQGHNVSLAGGF